jgi:hypothetical protein
MPVLVTGIHVAPHRALFPVTFLRTGVDGRNKSGHDEGGGGMNLPLASVHEHEPVPTGTAAGGNHVAPATALL